MSGQTFDVARADYLFGQRKRPGKGAGPFEAGQVSLLTGGARLYGLAIASRSEVRGVRVGIGHAPGDPGGDTGALRWVEVVEGAPVALEADPDAQVFLDRLDAHDGRLTLSVATSPEGVLTLPVDVAPESSIVISAGEALASTSGDLLSVYMAPPRVATGGPRKVAGTLTDTHATVAAAASLYGVCRHSRTRDVVLTSAILASATTIAAASAQTAIAETECAALDHALVVISGSAGFSVYGRLVLR